MQEIYKQLKKHAFFNQELLIQCISNQNPISIGSITIHAKKTEVGRHPIELSGDILVGIYVSPTGKGGYIRIQQGNYDPSQILAEHTVKSGEFEYALHDTILPLPKILGEPGQRPLFYHLPIDANIYLIYASMEQQIYHEIFGRTTQCSATSGTISFTHHQQKADMLSLPTLNV